MRRPSRREPGPVQTAVQDLIARCQTEQSRVSTLQVIIGMAADVLKDDLGGAKAASILAQLAAGYADDGLHADLPDDTATRRRELDLREVVALYGGRTRILDQLRALPEPEFKSLCERFGQEGYLP